MRGFGLKTWSNEPPDDKLGLVFGGFFAVAGLVMLCSGLAHLAGQPWDLAERGVETVGVMAERDIFTGDRYSIQVDGETYTCHRGQEKLGVREVPVLYDPEDPSRCRAKDTADRPGTYEYTFWGMAIPMLLLGISIVLARLAEPREVWARTEPEGLLRPRLMWISRGLAVLALLGMVLGLPAIFGGADPPKSSFSFMQDDEASPASDGEAPRVEPQR